MITHHAQRLQLVETHIGRSDGRNGRIQHHALHNLLLFLLVRQTVENGKHVGELSDLTVHLTVLDGVIVQFLLVAPESLLDLVAQVLGQNAVLLMTKSINRPFYIVCCD